MSNLLKYNSVVVKNNEKMVIDSNRLMSEMMAQRAVPFGEDFSQKRQPDEDGFISGLDASIVEQLVAEDEAPVDEEQIAQSRNMIAQAEARAQEILAEAQEEADRIIANARTQGYEEGLSQARDQADKIIAGRRAELEKQMEDYRAQLQRETEEIRMQMEPVLVETLLNVYTKATRAIAEDKKDMIYFLVDNVLRNAEMSHEFTIRVSEDDYKFLLNNKDKLYGANSPDVRIDVIKDASFERNQCIIETDTGVFDCSLDIQLDNLRESIHLLSCLQE